MNSKPLGQDRHAVQLLARARDAVGERVQLRHNATLFEQRRKANWHLTDILKTEDGAAHAICPLFK